MTGSFEAPIVCSYYVPHREGLDYSHFVGQLLGIFVLLFMDQVNLAVQTGLYYDPGQ